MFQVSKVDLLSSVDQKKALEFYENQNDIIRAIPIKNKIEGTPILKLAMVER